MDLNRIGLHIYELRNQFNYIEGNVSILNQSLERSNQIGAFMALQSIFLCASQISRILWAPRKKGKARAEELRKFLRIPDDHPLNNTDIQTVFDFSDEKTEEWVKKSKGQYILVDYIGDLAESEHKDAKIEHIYRSFDLRSKIFVYRGVGFQMENVMEAMRGISEAVNKAHYHLFPDQWKDVDQKPGEQPLASQAVNAPQDAKPAAKKAQKKAKAKPKAKAKSKKTD